MNGWMPDVEHIPTAAYGYPSMPAGQMIPIAIVNHIMQGYQRTMIDWANERPYVAGKSAHFSIGRSGRIVQHVSILDPAWHAGAVREATWPLLRFRAGLAINPNLYTVGIEHEGFSVDPGYGYDYLYSAANPWPQAMVDASVRVQKWVCSEVGIKPSTDTIIGHRDIDGVARANDPGPQWPQAAVIGAIKGVTIVPSTVPPKAPTAFYRPDRVAAFWTQAYANGAKPIRYDPDGKAVYEIRVKG